MSNTIPRPDWFTKEYYLSLKEKGVTDREMYEGLLFVSLKTFTRYKREMGVLGVGNQGGHNRKVNVLKAAEMRRRGYTFSAIGERYGAHKSTVLNSLKRASD